MLVHPYNEMLLSQRGEKKRRRRWYRGGELSIQVTTWINLNILYSMKKARLKRLRHIRRGKTIGRKNRSLVARGQEGMGEETDFN